MKPIANYVGERGGMWLGYQYKKKYGKESITVKTLKEGIKAQQRIWTNLKIKKSDEQLEKVQKALTPEQKKLQEEYRDKLLRAKE